MSGFNEVQQQLLEDLFDHWEQHGDGPTEVALDIRWRSKKLKLDQTVKSLPGLVERIEDYSKGDRLRLRLHAFAHCARGMPVIDAYLKLIDRAVTRFKANPHVFAEIKKEDLREILGTSDPAIVDRYSLVVMQGCTGFRGGGPHTDEWSFRVGTGVIRYAGVTTWSEYLRIRELPEQRLAKLGPEHRKLLQAICAYWCKFKRWPRATDFIIEYLPHGNAYILSSQMPHLFRRREDLDEPAKEVPFRLTLDAVIEAGNVDSDTLPLLAEIISAICGLYAESEGRKTSITAEEVADRLPKQPAADVLRVGQLLQFHNQYFGISVDDTAQGSWVARPAKECLDFLEWMTFDELWRNRKRAETMEDWMYPVVDDIPGDPEAGVTVIAPSDGGEMKSKKELETWDVFISHASEDKKDFVEPLATKLKALGLRVWYDKFVLKLGDSLLATIDAGLAQSRFGVVVLSPAFFKKSWPRKELDGLVALEVSNGKKVILPIWHNLTHEDVAQHSPTLAGRLAASSKDGLDEVVRQIKEVLA